MTILSMILTIIAMALLLMVSGVGIVFFGEWAWYVLNDTFHHHHLV
ncbi:MAG: hypothetical protein Q4E53_14265 [Eubacteriales bacterium]|nr:hypothetical protein [Eubacteriales bacterium]